MIKILKLKDCETCLGGGQLVQDEGPLRGMIIPCPDCAGNYKTFSNQYGTDIEDSPEVYIDQREGIVERVKENKGDYLILTNGTELQLNTNQNGSK